MPTFVLERFHWRRTRPESWLRLSGENIVAVFDAAADAHTEQARREAEARAVVGHPFRCGASLQELTTLPEFAFLDWLRDADLDPPDPDPDGRTPWWAWADLYSDEWTPAQLLHAWEGCNRVRFFRVRERAGDVLHCICRIYHARVTTSEYVGLYQAESEGGTPVALWHSRPAAESDLSIKQQLAADEVAAALATIGDDGLLFDPSRRVEADSPFADVLPVNPVSAAVAIHCELIEVERGDAEIRWPLEPLGDTAFVVLRFGWDAMTEDLAVVIPGRFWHDDDAGGVPVRVFANRSAAETWAAEREAEARAAANPFRFDHANAPAVASSSPQPFPIGDDQRLVRYLTSVGLIPLTFAPGTENDVYPQFEPPLIAWWDRHADTLTDEQRAAVWACFRQLRFYTVREVRVGDARHRPARRVRTLYYVRATNWVPDGGPGLNPHRFLGAFADPTRAEAVRAEAERQARTNQTPMPCFDWSTRWELHYSSWSKADMRRHFAEHGLISEAEATDFVPNPYWWDELRPRLRPRQAAAFWEVLDRVRLYEVLKLETEVPT